MIKKKGIHTSDSKNDSLEFDICNLWKIIASISCDERVNLRVAMNGFVLMGSLIR